MRNLLLSITAVLALQISTAYADVTDPFDPFAQEEQTQAPEQENDDLKSATELLSEARDLFLQEHLLDGRTKLLKALQKDPKNCDVHIMLAGYYIQHVGHFRLALRYALQAQQLFFEKHGNPPYRDYTAEFQHKQILYLLIQSRLNLDNYQGAFDTLEEFNSYGYYEEWYPGTRAWVLMKLGKLDEAISVARLGVLSGAEGGRQLNMLGILLSMHGEREESLRVFKEAIQYELYLGPEGQPATPLNNSGEVYKESYLDDRAESAWLRATSLPDGCEHVLPSLNLTLLYIEQLSFKRAKDAMDSFESCVAQYPLRNGEEHRALVAFARGRIALHTGHIDTAIKLLESALEERQWFGKIGTDAQDLQTGAMISMSQALTIKRNIMKFAHFNTLSERLNWIKESTLNSIRAWWLMRRARQMLAEDLADFEDLEIRHSDSMLEYPTIGEAMAGFPTRLLRKRISKEEEKDLRPGSEPYYKAYLAENLIARGDYDEAYKLLERVIDDARPQFDKALLIHAKTLLLRYFTPDSADYGELAQQIFEEKRAQLRNYGYRLPVNFVTSIEDKALDKSLGDSAFDIDNGTRHEFTVHHEFINGEHVLSFESSRNTTASVKVRGADVNEVVQRFSDEVFSEDL